LQNKTSTLFLQEQEAHFCSKFKNNPSLSRRTKSHISSSSSE